jgi:hypothetical protein
VARWFLCVPATSAESERTFSLAGSIVSSMRARLSGDRVNDLVLLQRHLAQAADTAPDRRGHCLVDGTTRSVGYVDLTASASAAVTQDATEVDEGDALNELLQEGSAQFDRDGLLACAAPSDGTELLGADEPTASP